MRSSLLLILALAGCGNIHYSCDYCDVTTQPDEMVGAPIRPLEDPVPGQPNLPTPAAALSMSGPIDYNAALEQVTSGVILSSVGFYSRGKIWSYEQLQSSPLYIIRNPSRAYANYFVADTLRAGLVSYYAAEPSAERVTIWDISQKGGGDIGHISHQLGLDVDVKYTYVGGRTETEANIDFQKTWSLVKAMVATGQVQRMFMDTYIKRKLCGLSKFDVDKAKANETLRRLRYWPGHDNHVHFRFYCPAGDNLCVPQDEVPTGTGCQS